MHVNELTEDQCDKYSEPSDSGNGNHSESLPIILKKSWANGSISIYYLFYDIALKFLLNECTALFLG